MDGVSFNFAGSCLPVLIGQDGSPSLTLHGEGHPSLCIWLSMAPQCPSTMSPPHPVPSPCLDPSKQPAWQTWTHVQDLNSWVHHGHHLCVPKADPETGTWLRGVYVGGSFQKLSEAVQTGAREEGKVWRRCLR